jgi:hypothetical protein
VRVTLAVSIVSLSTSVCLPLAIVLARLDWIVLGWLVGCCLSFTRQGTPLVFIAWWCIHVSELATSLSLSLTHTHTHTHTQTHMHTAKLQAVLQREVRTEDNRDRQGCE